MYEIMEYWNCEKLENCNDGLLDCWKKEMKEYWENVRKFTNDTITTYELENVGIVLKTPTCDIENTMAMAGEY